MSFYSDSEELITELTMNYSFSLNIIIEGNDDKKFLESTITGSEKINFVCAGGAENVTDLITKLDVIVNTKCIVPTFGIIDRDYSIPLGFVNKSLNLLLTDYRDLECMMISSPSFNTVLNEFGSKNKIDKIGGSSVIRDKTISAASVIAELRYHSQFSGIKLSFKMIDIEKLIDKKALTIINSALIPHLNSRQIVNGPCLPKTAIADAAATCKQARCSQGSVYFSDPLLLCRGHDLMEILAIGFRSLFGTRTASESSRENIESLFRLNYSRHFKSSALAQSINTWLRLHALHPQVMID